MTFLVSVEIVLFYTSKSILYMHDFVVSRNLNLILQRADASTVWKEFTTAEGRKWVSLNFIGFNFLLMLFCCN